MPEQAKEERERVLKEVTQPTDYVNDLLKRSESFIVNPKFKPGDIVVWKKGMQNKTIPDDIITPGIVLNNFTPPLKDVDAEIGSSYFHDILDIQVGFITNDNDFIVFAHDSRRFELYKY